MPRIEARRLLDKVDQGDVTLGPEALYQTALLATGSKDVANIYFCGAVKRAWGRKK
jgi:hypothetical protein